MTWFRVDDGLLDNPKVEQLHELLSDSEDVLHAAMHIWLVAGVHSSRNLTDGVVREAKLRTLTQSSRKRFDQAVDALVAVGLFTREPGAVAMHDWAEWNPTADEVRQKRERDAARKAGRALPKPSAGTPIGGAADAAENPVGLRAESTTTPNAPDPLPIPIPIPCESARPRARTRVQEQEHDPRRSAVLEALAQHLDVWPAPTHAGIADAVMARQIAGGARPPDWLATAVHEAAGSILDQIAAGVHVSAEERAQRVGKFCQRARAPRPDEAPAEPDRAALKARPTTRLASVEASPPPPEFRAAFGRRAGGDS